MQQKLFPLQVLSAISAIVFAAFYNYYAAALMVVLFKAMIFKDKEGINKSI